MGSSIHFRIDDETKRLAMQAAERQQSSLTEIMRQRAEELAAEELAYQSCEHVHWLEQQIVHAFERHDSGGGAFVSDDEVNNRMNDLRMRATQGKL